MTVWRSIASDPITRTSNHMLLWRADWIDEDFNPTGVLMGFFQEGDAGEAYYGVASYSPCHDTYNHRELHDPAEWPTHCANVPCGPST